VLGKPGDKASCFERVLELDPDNEDAAASLERLRAILPAEGETLICAFHPKVETVLRCSQCGRPICVRCAQPYAVGQLCPVCVRGRRPLYYQANFAQLAAVGAASLGAAALAGMLASLVVGWSLILAILAGPAMGNLLARAALWAGRRRRGLAVQITAGVCIVLGGLLGGGISRGSVPLDLSFLVYVALTVGSAVTWLH